VPGATLAMWIAGAKSFSFTDTGTGSGGGAPAPAPAPVTVDFRTAALTGGIGAQTAGGLDLDAKGWNGAVATVTKTAAGLGVQNGGRFAGEIDHNAAGGSESLSIGFATGVDAVKLALGSMLPSEGGKAEVGAWKAFDAAGAVVGQGVLDPRSGTNVGASAYEFTIDPAAGMRRLELTAVPYNNGAVTGGTGDSSDFSVLQVTYWQDAVL
jgi:hypothetical protein